MSDFEPILRSVGGDAAAIIEAAQATAEPKDLDHGKPQIVVVPAGAAAQIPDLSAWRDAPYRRSGLYRPATVEALADYTEWQQVDDQTTVWVHPTSGRVEAVFDDNGAEPGYREHRAVLQLQPTPEWTYWAAKDGHMGGQEDFALHIEGGLAEIEQPAAADLLEIAQSFHATKNAAFRSALRLASGEQQFTYSEEIEAKAGRTGQLSVPTTFVLMLAPFVGEEERQVVAKLRYRLHDGRLQIGYQLERPDKVVREALDAVAEQLAAKFPRVFVGEPAA